MVYKINQLISDYVQRTGANPNDVAQKLHDIAESIGYGHNGEIFNYGDFVSEEDFSSYVMSLSGDISLEDAKLLYNVLDADGENGLSYDEMGTVRKTSSSTTNYQVDSFSFWNLLLSSRPEEVSLELEKVQSLLNATQSALDSPVGSETEIGNSQSVPEEKPAVSRNTSSASAPQNALSLDEIEDQGFKIEGDLIKDGDRIVGEIRTEFKDVFGTGQNDLVEYGILYSTSKFNENWKEKPDGKILDENNNILTKVSADDERIKNGNYTIDGDKILSNDNPPVVIGRQITNGTTKSYFLYGDIVPDNTDKTAEDKKATIPEEEKAEPADTGATISEEAKAEPVDTGASIPEEAKAEPETPAGSGAALPPDTPSETDGVGGGEGYAPVEKSVTDTTEKDMSTISDADAAQLANTLYSDIPVARAPGMGELAQRAGQGEKFRNTLSKLSTSNAVKVMKKYMDNYGSIIQALDDGADEKTMKYTTDILVDAARNGDQTAIEILCKELYNATAERNQSTYSFLKSFFNEQNRDVIKAVYNKYPTYNDGNNLGDNIKDEWALSEKNDYIALIDDTKEIARTLHDTPYPIDSNWDSVNSEQETRAKNSETFINTFGKLTSSDAVAVMKTYMDTYGSIIGSVADRTDDKAMKYVTDLLADAARNGNKTAVEILCKEMYKATAGRNFSTYSFLSAFFTEGNKDIILMVYENYPTYNSGRTLAGDIKGEWSLSEKNDYIKLINDAIKGKY